MLDKYVYKFYVVLVVGILAIEPVVGYAQTNLNASDFAALASLSQDLDGRIIFSSAEKALWEESINDQALAERDKRLTNFVLPALAKEFGQMHVDILKDYATEDTQKSRLLASSEGISQRYFAKAASITSLGTVNCADSATIFMRELDPDKTLWLNKQDASPNVDKFFGRNFDTVARQSLLLPIRSFTNRFTTAQTWSSMLQQIAKGEIEERFDLQPGILANTPNGELDEAIARARLARQLGLHELPNFTSISSFYALLGQSQVEAALNLPSNSFVSHNDTRFWYETYQNIGLRVLEDELDLPDSNISTSPFPATTGLVDLPRFQLLAKRMETRGAIYKDPGLALGLPTEGYLPTVAGGSDIYTRLKNGDPDAFAAVGAYFLADSLQVSAATIAELVQSVLRGENRAVNLATAHPLAADLKADQLFNGQMTVNQLETLFKEIGGQKKGAITEQLARVNGNTLFALTGGSQAPTLSQIESLFTNQSELSTVLNKLGASSAADADYGDGFSAVALQRRGEQILGEALDIDPIDLKRLSDPNDSALTTSIAHKIDRQLGWDSINDKPFSRLFATGQLTDRQMLGAGINHLWNLFAFSESLKGSLNGLFFENTVSPVVDDEIIEDTGSAPFTQASPPSSRSNDSSSDNGNNGNKITEDDEVVVFAILGETPSIGDALTAATGIGAENLVPLLSGRFNSGLKIVTLSQMAKVLGDSSTVTTAKLLNLYDKPSPNGIESVANQGEATLENGFISTDFFQGLKQGEPWQVLDDEIVRNWNIDCPNHQAAAKEAVNSLVAFMSTWPETTNDEATEATRPVQLFMFNRDNLSDSTRAAITAKYPTASGSKSGVFSNPRNWDDIYIGL